MIRIASLWGPLVVISVLSVVGAFLTWSSILRNETPEEHFARASRMGELEEAESLSWQLLQKKPSDIEAWIRFLDARAAAHPPGEEPAAYETPVASDAAIRSLLAQTGAPAVTTMATYWYEESLGTADASPVVALADAQPPARLANYLLARAASERREWPAAALHYEREGLSFVTDRDHYLRGALEVWMRMDDWKAVRQRAADPNYASAFDAYLRLELATHDRDWARVLLWAWPAGFSGWQPWPLVLAVLAAALWFVIAGRLGRMQDRVPGRMGLYLLSFVLGVISVGPTLVTIVFEEELLGLRQLGQFVPDAIYFIFGVGLREEAWKLILFLPLLPALLRRGSRIEAMTCGALVGLGFAAEENIGYFHQYGAAAALARFLTANFLHMSLTALIALSVFDTRRGRATPSDGFSTVFPMAVIIHGAYDFFLTTHEVPLSSIISMALFFIIARQFLRQLTIASSREEEQGVLYLLIASLALITGVAYIYATTLVGPWYAVRLMSVGALGVAIVIWMFVRELSPA